MMDRSRCPKCKKQIAWYDNIPVISFLLLRGKCRHCKEKISIQYPIVELVTGILFVLAFYMNYKSGVMPALRSFSEGGGYMLRDFFIISVMIVIFIYDLRWYLILDRVTLPAAGILFFTNIFLGINWQNLLISGIIGAGFFLIQFIISRGKWIGGGDIRLGLLMGFALGWPGILVALFIAYILGSIIGIGLVIASKKKWGSEIPFGVFLTTATIITMFWGTELTRWYLGLIGM